MAGRAPEALRPAGPADGRQPHPADGFAGGLLSQDTSLPVFLRKQEFGAID